MREVSSSSIAEIHGAANRAISAGDLSTARRIYSECLRQPNLAAMIQYELSAVCLSMGDHAAALRHASAVTLSNRLGQARVVRAKALRALKRLDAAATAFEQAIETPSLTETLRHSAALELADLHLNNFGDPSGAASRLAGIQGASLAAKASEARLLADLYMGTRSAETIARAFIRHARRHIESQQPVSTPRRRGARTGRTSLTRRPGVPRLPRIGIISPSLGASPVGFLTLGAWRELSRHARLVFFDRSGKSRDWLSEALRATATEWVAVAGQTPRQLYQKLQDSGLDALVDCGGWTDIDALSALSSRPVARQFKWVGGQALTTGLDCFDGFLTDEWQVPTQCEALYREPILRFEGPYVTYTPPPYFSFRQGASAKSGVYALVSNPAKISDRTLRFIRNRRPKRLLLIDQRWRYHRTRQTFMSKLERLCDHVEFVVPADHRQYLGILRDTPATFVDTRPYSMGLTAIELRLMGKPIAGPRHGRVELMCERHCLAHLHTDHFDDHAKLAAQLLAWIRA